MVLAMVVPQAVLSDPVENKADTMSITEEAPSADITEEEPTSSSDEEKPKKPKKIKDPNRGRILPIPVFITEPAVGEGLGLALAYFHRSKDSLDGRGIASPQSISEAAEDQAPPPTVTAVFGAYTNNETAAGGIGHMNSFKDDHIRFTGVAALANVNSTFYILDHPFKFNLEGLLFYQETRFRFGDSKWFWGIGLSYLDANTSFKIDLPEDAPIDLFQTEVRNAGLSAKFAWDTRDNTSMPNRGQLFDLAVWRYDESLSGDFSYWDTRLKLLSFHQLHEKFVLGLRFEYSMIDGRAPFFGVPWVSLRGIPAMRYQGERVATAEVEGRYNLSPKWVVLGFVGGGQVSNDIPILDTDQSINSYGLGGRYRIFEAQNIWIGIDVAKGPEDVYWYIKIGQAW